MAWTAIYNIDSCTVLRYSFAVFSAYCIKNIVLYLRHTLPFSKSSITETVNHNKSYKTVIALLETFLVKS